MIKYKVLNYHNWSGVSIEKFRVRKWVKLHPQKEILITSEHYKTFGDIGFIKIIIIATYKGKTLSFDPQLFEIMPSLPSVDTDTLSKIVKDYAQLVREQYLNNKKKPSHYF